MALLVCVVLLACAALSGARVLGTWKMFGALLSFVQCVNNVCAESKEKLQVLDYGVERFVLAPVPPRCPLTQRCAYVWDVWRMSFVDAMVIGMLRRCVTSMSF